MNGEWVATKKACEFYGVSGNTIRLWGDTGKVKCKRTHGNQRRYYISTRGFNDEPEETKQNYLYVRVSSHKQKDDLERQCDFLRDKYPDHIVIKDIGSGLNYKRKGLLKMLELSNRGKIRKIVVFSKDRLCRFGFELLEWVFLQNDTKLLVHEQIDKSPETEFTEDILAILQVFACRWNGKRKYRIDKNKEIQIDIKQYPEKSINQNE